MRNMINIFRRLNKKIFPYYFVPSINLTLGAELIDGKLESAVEILKTLTKYLPPVIQVIKQSSCHTDQAIILKHVTRINESLAYCGAPKLKLITDDYLKASRKFEIRKMRKLKRKIIKESVILKSKISNLT